MKIASGWKDFEVLATGEGKKIENWNGFVLLRPDPQIVWGDFEQRAKSFLNQLSASYERSSSGGGQWQEFRPLPQQWTCTWKN